MRKLLMFVSFLSPRNDYLSCMIPNSMPLLSFYGCPVYWATAQLAVFEIPRSMS
jgi:hypothetical protein